MAKKTFGSVNEYLASLPEERKTAVEAVRQVILKNLPKGYEEGIQYGMIGYYVPHSLYPAGYHCDPREPLPFASLASQKNHMAVYAMCIYSDPALLEWFETAWAKTGKKLDMGKSCIRFKKLDDLPLEIIGAMIRKVPVKKHIAFYEGVLKHARKPKTREPIKSVRKTVAKSAVTENAKRPGARKSVAMKTSGNKAVVTKSASRKSVAKKSVAKKSASKATTKVTSKATGKAGQKKRASKR